MSAIKNVVHIGAAGALGVPILNAIVSSEKFNVTVFIRPTTTATFPPSVKTVTVDFDSVESLTSALRGQDAVISTVGTLGLQSQTLVVDAAIAAGVKRFLPSEFGSDLDNPKVMLLPVFGHKVQVKKYVEDKAAANPSFTYTNIRNGAFLDWGIEHSFLIDWKSGSPRIFDGGDQLFSSTSLASVGQAVVGVLEHPEETKNRAVYVQDTQISQNKLLALAKKVAPEKKWNPVPTSLDEIEKASNAAVARGEFTGPVMVEYINISLFKEGYGGRIEKNDNKLLGVAGNTIDADIEAIWKSYLF